MSSLSAILFLSLISSVWSVEEQLNYCGTNIYHRSDNTSIYFSKEVVTTEYAIEGAKFKSLHCCAANYMRIEWYKDGNPHPWTPGHVSHFILYPQEKNQTILSEQITQSDRGNYTCIVRNETHALSSSIILEVLEASPNKPKHTYVASDVSVQPGGEARFYCEAFVGNNVQSVPETHTDIIWYRLKPDGTVNDENGDNFKQTIVNREEDGIVGSLLEISHVKSVDYGRYMCLVKNNDAELKHNVTLYMKAEKTNIELRTLPQLILILTMCAFCALMVYGLWCRCGAKARLSVRILTENNVCDHRPDSMICYTKSGGAALVNGVLIPTLQQKYNYKLTSLELPEETQLWYDEMIKCVTDVRSLVVIISPKQYTIKQLHTALQQLRALPIQPVIVLIQDLPKLKQLQKDDQGETLITMLRKSRVLAWKHLRDKQFFTNLRLALPLPAHRSYNIETNSIPSVKLIKIPINNTTSNDYTRSNSTTALV